jgi:aspartyl protease family protein
MSDNETGATPGSMGRTMLLITWALIFAGLVIVFANWEGKQINPNQQVVGRVDQDGVREITLAGNRYHHYIATGDINGEPVVFLVDTGATDVSVPESLAEKLGLRKGMKGYAQTANGTVGIYATTIDKLTLGNLEFYDVPASINPGMKDMEVLLGMSALRHVELIQKDNKLTLRQYVQ